MKSLPDYLFTFISFLGKIILKVSAVILFLLLVCQSRGQSIARFSFYSVNQEYFNPATSGLQVEMKANTFYRAQWFNVEGAPRTIGVSGTMPINLSAGAGLMLVSDQVGNSSLTNLSVDGSYRIPVNFSHLGVLSFGMRWNIRVDNFQATEEQVGDHQYDYSASLDVKPGFGLFYYDELFFAGISLPKFSRENIRLGQALTNGLHINAGSNFVVSGRVRLRPSILIRSEIATSLAVEGNILMILNDLWFVGGGYRNTGNGFFLLGFKINDRIELDYAYDMGYEISGFNPGASHEVHVTFKVDKIKKVVLRTPRCFGGKWKNYVYN